MRLYFTLLFVYTFIQGYGQSVLPGTNIQIDLPDGFKPTDVSNTVAGFVDADNSLVSGAQMQMPVSIQTSFSEQEKSLIYQGFNILSKKLVRHNGYEGILIEYQGIDKSEMSITLIFGEEGFQNFIFAIFPKARLNEFRNILLSSSINKEINTNEGKILGFSAIKSCGKIELKSQNSLLMYYEYKNELGELKAYLNLTKFLKEKCLDQEITDCLDILANKYFPNNELINSERKKYSEGIGERRIYIPKPVFSQVNYLTMIELEHFNIMIVGGSTNEKDIECLDEIVASISLISH